MRCVVSKRNAYKTALCSVSYCFTGSRIYTDGSSSKGIRVQRPKNSK